MTTATKTNYSKMKMPELRAIAKGRGIQTGRRKRVDVEADLRDTEHVTTDEHGNSFIAPTQSVAESVTMQVDSGSSGVGQDSAIYVGPQTGARIAELEAQVAALQQNPIQQQSAKPQGGVGPNYWLWTHTQRKTELIGEGMNPAQFGGNKDAEIAALQANDHRTRNVEPFPHPSLAVNVVEDYQPVLRPCTISPLNSMGSPINGARRIIDNAGNCIAAVYRQGKVVAGVETIMDMEANATTVLEAFNG